MNKNNLVLCPICRNEEGTQCEQLSPTGADRSGFACQFCGTFELSGSLYAGRLDPAREALSPIERAALGHSIRIANVERNETPLITSSWLETFLKTAQLPSPAIQAANAIRYIGDFVRREGKKLPALHPKFATVIGAPSTEFASDLAVELKRHGFIEGMEAASIGAATELYETNLTLLGWQEYEKEKKGQVTGNTDYMNSHPNTTTYVANLIGES